jgi:two-component system osmolarity sensor histidine kinase EnvZ
MPFQAVALTLFWRTFALLAILLAFGVAAWVQTLRALEFEPRAMQVAAQVAALVDLSRAALQHADPAGRAALLKTVGEPRPIRLLPHGADDTWQPFEVDRFTRTVSQEVHAALGNDALLARSVNGQPGLWVGFSLDEYGYWVRAENAHAGPVAGGTGFVWIGLAVLATLLGSVGIARLIVRPVRQLSFAASRIRDGDLDSRLDEGAHTSEVRDLNMGFNRMARELAQVEVDRAVMMAGISHDLRTPLARLRLEAEMSVADEEARRNMVDDIQQLDAIIDMFMDYARPGVPALRPVRLAPLIEREAANFRDAGQIRIESTVAADTIVMADDTELGRVFANLFENARRYGRDNASGIAMVSVSGAREGAWIVVSVRDRGQGVDPEKLGKLTTPFFRGDAARTEATGAGLGLAIVEKALQRMGGSIALSNASDGEGGLLAEIRLKRGI